MLTAATITGYLVCAPAVLFGTWLGLSLFDRIDDAAFRRVVLIFLIASGANFLFYNAVSNKSRSLHKPLRC